ncbi:hypothetical protein [Plantibacter sp. T3]|uniref:hypothetical protein n=1 Tax=Plantibacter sp. T3 TaxID=2653161 RepID=UPI001356C996|nr:hypothetical protein [Plantibacter sp. T3]
MTAESLVMASTLTPEELAVAYVEGHLSQWAMMGATAENRTAYFESGGDFAVIQDIATENAALVASSTFIGNWKESPQLLEYVSNLQQLNGASLELWFKTSDDPNRNDEPYRTWIEVNSGTTAQQNPDGSTVLTTDATSYNNADKNRAKELNPNTLNFSAEPITYTTTFQTVDGQFRVSGIQVDGR